ncbi:MAG TPA: DUF6600 domain-containing protein [Chthonomonadaceae bacterium]|nr:DUF6600 domain-containing protein [Chthonomonadaceae bacterium]
MLPRKCQPWRWLLLLGSVLGVGLLSIAPVIAQDTDRGDSDPNYRMGEDTTLSQPPRDSDPADNPQTTDPKAEGPVRMARFAYVKGDVTWRPDANSEWSKATANLPMRQGAEIWVHDGGRADIQFDDGSSLRLGNNALAILTTLYSDNQGEFSQITLNDGLATMHSRHGVSVYQVDTPAASVKFSGDTQVRFGVDGGSEIAVQRGSANVESQQGKVTVEEGKYLYLVDNNSPLTQRSLPGPDSWDKWNVERNRLIEGKSETAQRVPPNIGLVAGDLDDYGAWRDDPKYGSVWVPRVSSPDWRPYYYGHWVWVDPFGWTWVSDEPWGWAPYHYGTWVDEPYGWAWCPGPRYQYWSPGVVGFCSYGGEIGWAPLCPWEVRYPVAFGLGFGVRDWWLSFSIGWAGCYFPGRDGFCEGRRFDNFFVNRRFHDGSPAFARFQHSAEGFAAGHHFVPFNASHAAGATIASASAFGGRGSYQAAARGTSFFTRGQTVGAPSGRTPFSGPTSVQPTSLARTSTRSFSQGDRPPQSVLQRSITRAPLPTNVQRSLPATSNRGSIAQSGSPRTGMPSGSTGRPSTGLSSGSLAQGSSTSRSPAEAARQARQTLGWSGEHGSSGGYSRGNGGYGEGSSGGTRNYGSSGERNGYASGRNGGNGSSPYSSGRGYSGGSYSEPRGGTYSGPRGGTYGGSPSYRVGPNYGSRSYGGGNSGGGGGGSRSGGGGGGGGRPSGGGGGRGR